MEHAILFGFNIFEIKDIYNLYISRLINNIKEFLINYPEEYGKFIRKKDIFIKSKQDYSIIPKLRNACFDAILNRMLSDYLEYMGRLNLNQ